MLVAKDPSFSNLVDYAFTQIPAYAPRTGSAPRTYPDETTLYYWAVLPATNANGTGAVGDPLSAAAQSFQKQSAPPTRLGPADGTQFFDQPTFRWTPTEGARRYRIQVAQDPSFGTPDRRSDDRLDLVHEQHDLPRGHGAVLASPRRRREQRRADLVDDRHVPEEARNAGSERDELNRRRIPPRVVVEPGQRRGFL